MRPRRPGPPALDPVALVAQAYEQRLAALERLRVARSGVVAARARADDVRREALAETDAVLEAAVELVQQQLDGLRRQRAQVGSAADPVAELAGVRADLEALAIEFAPVMETLAGDEGPGPDPPLT